MAKSLMQLPTMLRSVSTLSRHFSTAKVYYHKNELQEVNTEVKLKSKAGNIKELFDILKTDIKPSNLIANIEINKKLADGRHIVTALTSLYTYYKGQSISEIEIQKSQEFQQLCLLLNKRLLTLDRPEIIQSLKIFNLLKVPSSTVLMQTLLQLVRNSVNDLNLNDIFYLSYLLQRMEPTPLSEALITALPEVFKAQYQLQIDKDNIKELKSSLRFASDYTQEKEIVEYLIDAIDNFKGSIDLDTALHIFWSLSIFEELPDNYLSVLIKVKRVIKEYISIMTVFETIKTLKHISISESKGVYGFYDTILVDKLVDNLIGLNAEFEKSVMSLNNLNRMKHINLKLLDCLLSKCCENPKLLLECHALCLMTLSVGFLNADYKPKNWDVFKKLLIKHHERLLQGFKNYTYFAVNLASLDCFDSSVFETAFTFEFNPTIFENFQDDKFKKLYYSAKLLYPEYSGPWPSNEVIETFKDASITDYKKLDTYPLLPALKHILQDSSLIKTNLKTKEGIYIDHLIILKDRSPVAFEFAESQDLQDSTVSVEDLNIPSELKRVAVLLLPREVYGRNVKTLRASVRLNIKLLQALSYEVISISEEKWHSMPENELIPYLLRFLNIKTSDSASKKFETG